MSYPYDHSAADRGSARAEASDRGERKARRLKPAPLRSRSRRERALTIPDLVLLSLLAEKPMHGYQANEELERREVRDWAGISRPQVYYSLEKLARRRLLRAVEPGEPAAGPPPATAGRLRAGPDRHVFETTESGRRALAGALERDSWTRGRERPAFITWLALSWQASPRVVMRQVQRRERFVGAELSREQEVLRSIFDEVGHPYHEAVWAVSLTIAQFQTELRWLRKLARELPRRAPAKRPAYAEETE
ncbi:MAG TPA: PadR family transcriptional regulator [Candidatus Acidoferrales bacterium]|nr:PadR family transcriptional regulator [Candidatus Acidoferrales bacterium]